MQSKVDHEALRLRLQSVREQLAEITERLRQMRRDPKYAYLWKCKA